MHPYWILIALGWVVRGSQSEAALIPEKEKIRDAKRERDRQRAAAGGTKATPYGPKN